MRQKINNIFNQQNAPTATELTDFVLAAGAGNNTAVNNFLDKYPNAIDAPGGYARFFVFHTALLEAATYGRTDTVNLLLQRGANINAVNPEDVTGSTPLSGALRNDKIEIAEILLKNGANIHDQNEESLLKASLRGSSIEEVKLLLKYGASFHDDTGSKALKIVRDRIQEVESDKYLEPDRKRELLQAASQIQAFLLLRTNTPKINPRKNTP